MSIHVTWNLHIRRFSIGSVFLMLCLSWILQAGLCNTVWKAVYCEPSCELQRATAFFGLLIHDTAVHSTSSSADLALPGEFALHASCFRKLRGTSSIVNLLPFRTCVDKCVERLQWTFKLCETREHTRPSVGRKTCWLRYAPQLYFGWDSYCARAAGRKRKLSVANHFTTNRVITIFRAITTPLLFWLQRVHNVTETSLTSNPNPSHEEGGKHAWQRERETSLKSNLSPFCKEGGKRVTKTNLTSNLSPSRKEGGKRAWQRD